jgi:hypothetical protein
MEPRRDDPFELIAIVYSQDELALVTSRLRSEGIWAISHSARHVAADIGLTLALGGVRLLVHADQAEEARGLLAMGRPWERTGGVYAGSRALDLWLALMLALVTGVPPPARIQSVLVERRGEPTVSR